MGDIAFSRKTLTDVGKDTSSIRVLLGADTLGSILTGWNKVFSIGPSLIHRLPPLLFRLRLGTIGVIADIKQTFLQICVGAEDRNVLRFLWWKDAKLDKFKIYRHCRMVLGISSKPFLLNAVVRYHLEEDKFQTETLQNTMDKLKERFYVDN
ncbi:uncharacterized protein TNCV_4928361 [Trichonephila clavipes]|nr:uncharacterized protein TNCV_4928361 [Trichonephila clavipes]